MSTVRKAQKRVYLLRARFTKNAPAGTTLQAILKKAIGQLPKIDQKPDLNATVCASATHGQLRINQHEPNGSHTELKVVALAPGENATTVPIKLQPNESPEGAAIAPAENAFKGGDFFVLLHGNNLLCVGDHLRLGAVESYLREFLNHVLPSQPEAAAFEILPVARKDKLKMLATEGIKEIELNSSLYAATLDEVKKKKGLIGPFRQAIDGIYESAQAVFKKDQTEALNEHLAEVQLKLTISVKGGLRGSEISRDAVEVLGNTLISNGAPAEDHDISPVLITNRRNRVSVTEASVSENFSINRRDRENSLNDVEVWASLRSYYGTLQKDGALVE